MRARTKAVGGDGKTKKSLRTFGDLKLTRLGICWIWWCGSGHSIQESTRLLACKTGWMESFLEFGNHKVVNKIKKE